MCFFSPHTIFSIIFFSVNLSIIPIFVYILPVIGLGNRNNVIASKAMEKVVQREVGADIHLKS